MRVARADNSADADESPLSHRITEPMLDAPMRRLLPRISPVTITPSQLPKPISGRLSTSCCSLTSSERRNDSSAAGSRMSSCPTDRRHEIVERGTPVADANRLFERVTCIGDALLEGANSCAGEY